MTWASASQTIEHIKNYNTMLSTYLPVSSSPQDLVGHMGVTSLTSANVAANKIMMTQVNADKAALTGGSEFSIPLPCGLRGACWPILSYRSGRYCCLWLGQRIRRRRRT